MGEVVVGVDESRAAAQALRWATAEAALHGWRVTAVLAWGYVDQHHAIVGERFDLRYGAEDADAALAAIVSAAVGDGAAAGVDRLVVRDLHAQALLEVSAGADLLVVGARGLGGFKGLLLGSVSQYCLHHATIPMAVVRSEPTPVRGGHVVVGVDGSATARRALAWAVDEACRRGATLTAASAWHLPIVGAFPYARATLEPADFERAAHEVAMAAIGSVDTSGLVAPVEVVVRPGGAAAVLLEVGEGADLVVLGARGLGGLAGLILGSVAVQVAQHATSTVVVVPARP